MWQTHLIQIGRSVDVGALDMHDDSTGDNKSNEGIRRVLRQIVQRRGQPAFREQLLNAYEGRLCRYWVQRQGRTGSRSHRAIQRAILECFVKWVALEVGYPHAL